MRILFATNHSHLPQRVGGSESSTHDLCLTLQELGIEVAVLCWLQPKWPIGARHRPRLAWRAKQDFVKDETMGYPVFRAKSPAAAALKVVRIVRPALAVIQAGRPLVLTERLTALGLPCLVYLRDAFFGLLGSPVRHRPDIRYVATSSDLAQRFARTFGVTPATIPPIVRPERYRVHSMRKSVTFICPVPKKGVRTALALAARRSDVPFLFQESWWIDPVSRFLLTRRIRSLPNVTLRRWSVDVRTPYQEAKIVLVPSRCPEAWGRVVSEAQVSGIPALASAYGGLPESVGDGGILVDPTADLKQWENGLARLWDDSAEYNRLAEFAKRHARRADFQPRVLATRFLAEVDEFIGSRV